MIAPRGPASIRCFFPLLDLLQSGKGRASKLEQHHEKPRTNGRNHDQGFRLLERPPVMSNLDENRSICIQEKMLGTVRTLRHRGRKVRYRLPAQIDGRITLRFKGHGRTDGAQTGDLLLGVSVDRGQDIAAALWLPATEATGGAQKKLLVGEQLGTVTVPPHSRDGEVICVARAGQKTPYQWGQPFFGRKRGNLRARLEVFPDVITPQYGAVDGMSNEDLALEGWIYRQIDLAMSKVGQQAFRLPQ